MFCNHVGYIVQETVTNILKIKNKIKNYLTNREIHDIVCLKLRNEAVIMRNLQFVKLNRDDDRQRM